MGAGVREANKIRFGFNKIRGEKMESWTNKSEAASDVTEHLDAAWRTPKDALVVPFGVAAVGPGLWHPRSFSQRQIANANANANANPSSRGTKGKSPSRNGVG